MSGRPDNKFAHNAAYRTPGLGLTAWVLIAFIVYVIGCVALAIWLVVS